MLVCRVLPAAALVRASFWRISAFSRLDFPTFERPTNANCGMSSRSTPSRGPATDALVTKVFTGVSLSRVRADFWNLGARYNDCSSAYPPDDVSSSSRERRNACLKNNSLESTSGSTSSTSDSLRSTNDFGQVEDTLERLDTGQGKMSDRIEALDQHMHVLHEDVIARIAATREYTGPTRAEFAELKEMLGRRLDPLEATVRLHSREIDKLKRGRR